MNLTAEQKGCLIMTVIVMVMWLIVSLPNWATAFFVHICKFN